MPGPLPLCSDTGDLPKFPFCFVENDEFPEMVITYQDKAGAGINLTGFTITLHLRRVDSSVLIKTATPLNLLVGQFKFSWGPGDLVPGVNQKAEIQFVDGAGKPLTSKIFLLDVREQIA